MFYERKMIFPSNIWAKRDILYYPAGINNCHSPTQVTLKSLESKFPLSNVVFQFGNGLPFFLLFLYNSIQPIQCSGWSEKTLSQIAIKNDLPLWGPLMIFAQHAHKKALAENPVIV